MWALMDGEGRGIFVLGDCWIADGVWEGCDQRISIAKLRAFGTQC